MDVSTFEITVWHIAGIDVPTAESVVSLVASEANIRYLLAFSARESLITFAFELVRTSVCFRTTEISLTVKFLALELQIAGYVSRAIKSLIISLGASEGVSSTAAATKRLRFT